MEEEVQEHWDSYIASYEEGKPGLTTLRMDLIETAPEADYPFALITGFNFGGEREDGFPEERDLQAVHDTSDAIVGFMEQNFDCVHVASFMYDFQRMEYFYLKAKNNVEQGLNKLYESQLPGYECYISIEEDKDWALYQEFLFPTDEIMHHMYDQKVVLHLEEAGDNLLASRRIDHWVLFAHKGDLERFSDEIAKQGFKVEGTSESDDKELPLQVQVWRNDIPELDTIFPVTSGLRQLAEDFNGSYDGWETVVTK
ncbi:DUF695 domain-containing protein [uncultured Microscilla sp.]|uniref:DUF695 domain-containing protein n=1 Tax=uncultured Microscilla sp. TaxID=432653 RepID=UPI0026226700|nr:DUF695 domain-containing protein [uncultured Microscilla sp.]